jgi:hypothetical protein
MTKPDKIKDMTTLSYAGTDVRASQFWKRLAIITSAWAMIATTAAIAAIRLIENGVPGFWLNFFKSFR